MNDKTYQSLPGNAGNIGGSIIHSDTSTSQNMTSGNTVTTSNTNMDNTLMQGRHEPYSDVLPTQHCCGGLNERQGLMILTFLVTIQSAFLLFNASRPIHTQDITNQKIDIFIAVGYVLLLPIFANLGMQVRWLLRDTLERRKWLVVGYKIQIISVCLFGMWQLVGAHILFGTTLAAFVIDNYP